MYGQSFKYQQQSISLTSSLLEQKVANSIFSKHYIRSNVLGNSSIQLLDNHTSFVNFTAQEIDKKYIQLQNQITHVGRSIGLDSFIFINKRNNVLKMDSFLEHKQLKTKNEISALEFWFNSLQKYKIKKKASCTILKSVKGGFFCYSGGIKGFLPRRQTLRAFFRTFFDFFKNHTVNQKISNLNFLTNKNHSFYENGLLKLPILLGKANLATRAKYKNFSYMYHKKRSRTLKPKPMNFLNFVFLIHSKKQKGKSFDSINKKFVQTLIPSNRLEHSVKKMTINSLKKISLKK